MTSYRLYLAIDETYVKRIPCDNLDKVEIELNKATGYDKYLVIEESPNGDTPIAMGRIEANRKLVKAPKKI